MRIVSLLPSATEIVSALGAQGELVGVSHECDFPEGVNRLPVLTSARIDVSASSEAIDTAVRAVLRDALSIYSVDERRLAEVSPDLIVTQDLCEVCAVSLDDVRAAVARLAHREDVRIVSLRPTQLGDVWSDIETVAGALGRADRGLALRREIEARVRDIERRARAARARPKVVTVEWLAPIMLGGTWMPELIELAGGEPIGARAGDPAPTITLAEMAAIRPDVVLVKPCGFPVERTVAEMPLVEAIARASGGARVYVTDGNAFFNRPGPRLVESLEILAACVHPSIFGDFAEKHAPVIREVTAAAS